MKKVKLSTIAKIYNGNSIKAKIKKEKYSVKVEGWNYIATKDINFDGAVIYDTGVIIPFDETGFKLAPANCVFVCSEGGSAGRKTAHISKEVCFGNKLYAITNDKGLFNSKYIYYYTRYREFFEQFRGLMNGIIGGVSSKKFGEIEIPLPPLPEQNRIVEKLDELFSELDNGIETLQKTKTQLKVYRQAVLKDAFEGCSAVKKVSDVCIHVTDGDHMPPPKSKTGIPFIMISNVKDNRIEWKNTSYVNESYFNKISDKRIPQNGDVLYTVTGSFGIPILIDYDKKFCFQRHIALLRPSENIIQKYLYYVLQSPNVYQQAKNKSTGTAQKTVGLGVLRNIELPYCEVNEQQEIVQEVETRLSICDQIEKTVDESLGQAESLRQSILKQAFEGRLV